MLRLSGLIVIGAGLLGPSQPAFAEPQFLQSDAISRIVEQVEPSVVSILRIRSNDEPPPETFRPSRSPNPLEDRELLPNDYGAGVLVKSPDNDELFVLTAYHVVRGGRTASDAARRNDRDGDPPGRSKPAGERAELELRFHHRRSCAAHIFAADPRSDLAVLAFDPREIGGDPAALRPLDWRNSPSVRKGEIVVCFGNPYALARDGSASVSWGIVSNLARRPFATGIADAAARGSADDQSLGRLGTILQIDARLQLGGSGGPAVNLQGQLVGIGTALAAIEGYEKSAGFAIPVAPPMRRIIETLLRGQEVEYGLLGITPKNVTADQMRDFELYDRQPTAVGVENVPEGSPAMQAGIRRNDILLKINEEALLSTADLMRVVGELPPETEVSVQLFRPNRFGGGELLTYHSKLGKWPVKDAEGIVATRPKYPAWRGLRVDYPSAREKIVKHEATFLPGVIVTDVAPASSADQAQLQPGIVITHVQGIEVRTPGEFHRAVKDLQGDVVLRLYADRPGDRPSVTLRD